MSGPENLRGVDYQISTSALLILRALAEDSVSVASIRFDSLDDEGEDLAFLFSDGSVREFQIKKLAEGYNWTPATIRPVLSKFVRTKGHQYEFVTDGSASRQVQSLGRYLSGTYEIDDELQRAVCGDGLDLQALELLKGRTHIQSRFYPSSREEDPAAQVREEVRKLLNRGSFSLTDSAIAAESALWAEIYALARDSREIQILELHEILARCGIRVQTHSWSIYPAPRRYYEHELPVEEIVDGIAAGETILITGIGGAGKTSVAAEAAVRSSEHRRVCWINVSELLEPADVVRVVADYAAATSLPEAAVRLRNAEAATFARVLAETLGRWPVSIVLDRFEAANERTAALIRDALGIPPAGTTHGSILLTAREIPLWWADLPQTTGVKHVSLTGMPVNSANELLEDRGVGANEAERLALMDTVGRHAQSLVLMAQVGEEDALDRLGGAAAAREWLLRRVLSELPDVERTSLARLAIFDYPAPLESAYAVLDELAPDVIRRLTARELLRVDAHRVTVHDALRATALELLTPKARSEIHRTVADDILADLMRQEASGEGILYDAAIRWAVHLQATNNLDGLSERIRFVLSADAEQLRDLFGVSYLGFSFDFEDPSLDSAWDRLDSMEEEGLIQENPANQGKEHLVEPAFILREFTLIENMLIRALCFHHGYAGQVGYMNDMRPNYTYRQHGLYCPWEHCIELMPLPPMSKAEWLESRENDEKRLASPEAAEMDENLFRFLTERANEAVPEWVVDAPDPELRERSCPVFGHACPHSKEQAQTCRSRGKFEWADIPAGWEGY